MLSIGIFQEAYTQQLYALSGSSWKPGRIIDDGIFTNNKDLSIQQIQDVLNQKATPCDTHGMQSYTYQYPLGNEKSPYVTTSKALYSYRKGNGAITVIKPDSIPDADNQWYTDNTWIRCLKDYNENPTTGQNNYANRPNPVGGLSSAALIWQAAQNHNISTEVLIVTLQKEQALITDSWPFQVQYIHALGAYCPDTAPCDPNHEGFGRQINDGAELFRYYLSNMTQSWWDNKKPGNNNIYYNPSQACGGSTVYIENKATAALYVYTPYQPNGQALDNLYGSGNGCSAYGNRNFWRTYSDWFGTTYADGYVAQFNAQIPLNEPFYVGESRMVYLQYKNIGSSRWYDETTVPAGISPVHLAASEPINRSSVFSFGWPSGGRPNLTFSKVYEADGVTLASNQHIVEPGQLGRFEYNISPPKNTDLGVHREYFQPVLEGAQSWNMGGQSWLDVNVQTRYNASFHSQSGSPLVLRQNNEALSSFMQYKNIGSAAWYDTTSVPSGYYATYLSTAAPIGRWSGFGPSWPSRTQPATSFAKVFEADGITLAANQHVVLPGQLGRFEFQMTAANNVPQGFYREYFQPLMTDPYHPYMNGVSWFDVNVTPPSFSAVFNLQSGYPTIIKGQSSQAFLQYKNVGSSQWYDDTSAPVGISPVHLAATSPVNRNSVFSYGWQSAGRPSVTFSKVYEADGITLSDNQHIVKNGQIARFDFNLTTPWNIESGVHREYFQPVLEEARYWNMGALSWLDITN